MSRVTCFGSRPERLIPGRGLVAAYRWVSIKLQSAEDSREWTLVMSRSENGIAFSVEREEEKGPLLRLAEDELTEILTLIGFLPQDGVRATFQRLADAYAVRPATPHEPEDDEA